MFTFRNLQKSIDDYKGTFFITPGTGNPTLLLNDANVLSTVTTATNCRSYGSIGHIGGSMFILGGDAASYSSGSWNSNAIWQFDGYVYTASAYTMAPSNAIFESGTGNTSSAIYMFGGTQRTTSGNPNTRTYVSNTYAFSNFSNTTATTAFPVAWSRSACVNFSDTQINIIGGNNGTAYQSAFRNFTGAGGAFSTLGATLTSIMADLPVGMTSSTQSWLLGGGTTFSNIVSWTSSGVKTNTSTSLPSVVYKLQGAAGRNGIVRLADSTSIREWDGTTLSVNSNAIGSGTGYVYSFNTPPAISTPT